MNHCSTFITVTLFAMLLTACGSPQAAAPAHPVKIEVTIYPQATKPAASDIVRVNAPAAEPTAETAAVQPTSEPLAAPIIEAAPTTAPLPTEAPVELADTPTPQVVSVLQADGAVEGIRNGMLALHNAARAAIGLHAYTSDAALQQAAQMHAEWLAQKPVNELWSLGIKAHFGPNNQSYVDRISAAGYATSANRMNENYGTFGTAQDAFDWWMNDAIGAATHRPQILSDLYSNVGIGVVKHSSGMAYVFIIKYAAR
jgi:uncharacterized protein YkwD